MEMKDQVSLQGKEEGDGFIKRASIGGESLLSPSTSSEEEEESEGGEVEKAKSQVKNGVFGCLGSLEDSLPIKRGLSSFFSGKSKSFSSLSDVGNLSTNNLAKTENSFNKRRRVRMASKAKRASYTLLISLPLPPPPPLLKDHISEEGDKEGIQEQRKKETNTI